MPTSSVLLLLAVVEVELTLSALNHEQVLCLLLNDAGVDKVADQHGRVPVHGGLLLHLLELALDLFEPGELGADVVLVLELLLGGLLHLSLGPSPLRGLLEHVHADAVLDCTKKRSGSENNTSTYLRLWWRRGTPRRPQHRTR